jgi:hypothetical protein
MLQIGQSECEIIRIRREDHRSKMLVVQSGDGSLEDPINFHASLLSVVEAAPI